MSIIGKLTVGDTAISRNGNHVTVLVQNVPVKEVFRSGEPEVIKPNVSDFILYFVGPDPNSRPVPDTAVVTVERVMEYSISEDNLYIDTLKFVYLDTISSLDNIITINPVIKDVICYGTAMIMIYAVPENAQDFFFNYISTRRSTISYCGETYHFHTMSFIGATNYDLTPAGIPDAGCLKFAQAVAYSTTVPAVATDQEAIKQICLARLSKL